MVNEVNQKARTDTELSLSYGEEKHSRQMSQSYRTHELVNRIEFTLLEDILYDVGILYARKTIVNSIVSYSA